MGRHNLVFSGSPRWHPSFPKMSMTWSVSLAQSRHSSGPDGADAGAGGVPASRKGDGGGEVSENGLEIVLNFLNLKCNSSNFIEKLWINRFIASHLERWCLITFYVTSKDRKLRSCKTKLIRARWIGQRG